MKCIFSIVIICSASLLISVYAQENKELEIKKEETTFPHQVFTMEGSKPMGKLVLEEVQIQTVYGKLNVPLSEIIRIIPGLKNHGDYLKGVDQLLADLSHSNFKKREQAQDALSSMGPKIKGLLLKRLEKEQDEQVDAELEARIKILLEDVDEIEENDEGFSSKGVLIQDDQIVTTSFVIKGTLSLNSFKFNTKYGMMNFSLKDVKNIVLKKKELPTVIYKTVEVLGTDFHKKNIKNTGIRLKTGNVLTITASGEIELTPWGRDKKSGPEGNASVGNVSGSKFPHGLLVCQIGNGSYMKVAKKLKYTVKESGQLKLGMVMDSSYTRGNYQFPGNYKVKVKVDLK